MYHHQFVKRSLVSTGLLVFLVFTSLQAAVPTFQELMDPAVFPDAQRGMEVESAAVVDGILKISGRPVRSERK